MAPAITNLSAQKLKELKHGETITLNYAEHENDVSRVMDDTFPKAVATTFSSSWSTRFPPVNKIKVGDLNKPVSRSITIVGGDLESHRKILSWMLSCCDGAGIREFEVYKSNSKPYSKYFMLRESAHVIGCTHLERLFAIRMEAIAEKQIHSEDIRALYLQLPPDHETLNFLNEHVADHIFNKTLKARSAYETLREELPTFHAGINAILEPRIARRKKEGRERRAEELAGGKREWKDGRFKKYNAVDDRPTIHTVVKCDIVRHSQSGRPSYARLDLSEVGVDRNSFTKGRDNVKSSSNAQYTRSRSANASQSTTVAQPLDEPADAKLGTRDEQQVPGEEMMNVKPKNRNARRRQKKRDAARKANVVNVMDSEADMANGQD